MGRFEDVEGTLVETVTNWKVSGTGIVLSPGASGEWCAWTRHPRDSEAESLRAVGIEPDRTSLGRAELVLAIETALERRVRLRHGFCVYRLVDRPNLAVTAVQKSGRGRRWRAIEHTHMDTWRAITHLPPQPTRREAVRAVSEMIASSTAP